MKSFHLTHEPEKEYDYRDTRKAAQRFGLFCGVVVAFVITVALLMGSN